MEFSTEMIAGAQAAFGIAGQLVQTQPSEDWVQTCIDEELFADAPFGTDDEAVAAGLQLLAAWCQAVRGNVAEQTAVLQRDWLHLFVGTGAPDAPIWESVYTEPNGTMIGQSTLDVRHFYRTWGLEYADKGKEPDDALGRMLAFCGILMGRELEALQASDEQGAAKAAQAQEDFLVHHLLPWASAWRFLVKEHAGTDYYRGVGELVFGLERSYARRFGIRFNPENGSFFKSAA